jgi:hypothetical protein
MLERNLKELLETFKILFGPEYLRRVAWRTGFKKRKGKITPEIFLAYHVFSGNDLCEKSLDRLCGRLLSQYGVAITPQGLDERYNKEAVNFLKSIFNDLMMRQNKLLSSKNRLGGINRILLNDSTTYDLPDCFQEEFKGYGGIHSKSSIKIQLQYDLLSGNFNCCEIQSGATNDSKYLKVMDEYTQPGDLRLADLGYYKTEYLKSIDGKKGFFISKIHSNTVLYKELPKHRYNKKGKLIKGREFERIDTVKLIESLGEKETLELEDVIIGSKKDLKARVIITKLSEENQKKRREKHLSSVRRKRGTINPRSTAWESVNVYITNMPQEMFTAGEIHEIYSLRWQIEIMFKIWKSIYEINKVKKMKIERFKCFLYGRLIAFLLSTIIASTAKNTIKEEENKEISEIKTYSLITEFFQDIRRNIFKNEVDLYILIKTIIDAIKKYGLKGKKKGKKTSNEIIALFTQKINKSINIAS